MYSSFSSLKFFFLLAIATCVAGASFPTVVNIFGAKPPQYLIGNVSLAYYNQQLAAGSLRILPNYRAVNIPETVSGDGIEMLLRGFGDIASSGRFIQAADYTKVGCNASLVYADGSGGPCNGRTPTDIGFVNDRLYFGVSPSNPVTDITNAQLSQAVNAILAGTPLTWSQLYPAVQFPSFLANAAVNVLNGPAGGGIPVTASVDTSIPIVSIPPLPSATISTLQVTTTNWLTFFIRSTGLTSTVKPVTYNGIDMNSMVGTYPLPVQFNAIIDTNSPILPAVTEFLCYILNYKFDPVAFTLDPLTPAQYQTMTTKLGCPAPTVTPTVPPTIAPTATHAPTATVPSCSTANLIFSQTLATQWTSGSSTIYQYNVVFTNTCPTKTIVNFVVQPTNWNPYGYWNLNNVASGKLGFPDWSPISSWGTYTSFGYQNYGGIASFTVVSVEFQ